VDPVGHDRKDEWDLAIRFRDIQRFGYLQPKEKKEMSEKAIQSVIERARESLGPIQKPYRNEYLQQSEILAQGRGHESAELDVEETLFRSAVEDPIFQIRTEQLHGLVLVIDTSLSMKGEKLALLGVSVACVVMSLPAKSVAILGFDSEIHEIKKFGEVIPVAECVERVLSIPPGGFTNIEKGLNTAREWSVQSGHPQARVVLVSDGRYTEGKDPKEVAQGFPFIYALKIGKDPTGREVMRDVADSGMGKFLEVREMRELPQILLKGIRSWVR
jgi:uncharacterized protein with von Willebrand factor type A (vWA) domain